jgi:hypothetical protein
LAAVRGSLQLLAEMPSSGLQSLAIVLVLRPSRSPSPEVLSRLCRCFEEGPQTYGWPGKTNYRFCNARSRLLLCDGDEQCDWSIQPASAELAAAALDEIEEIAGIGDNLYALRDQHEQALRQWRAIADKA